MYYLSFSHVQHYFFLKNKLLKILRNSCCRVVINADKMENACKLNAKRIYLCESDFFFHKERLGMDYLGVDTYGSQVSLGSGCSR